MLLALKSDDLSSNERGSLLAPPVRRGPHRGERGGVSGADILNWSKHADEAGAQRREYPLLVPWDMWLLIGTSSATLFALCRWVWTGNASQEKLELFRQETLLVGAFVILLSVLFTPRRVIYQSETFSVEFPIKVILIPAKDMLELMMVYNPGHVIDLFWRWGIFPFGSTFRFFLGMPSFQGSACALLANDGRWSCFFHPADPIQFLVDIQKPIDLKSIYRNVGDVLVRRGVTLDTKIVGTVRAGQQLRVEQQNGRRVYVHFLNKKLSGWISHINQLGYFLLTKEQDAGLAAAGTVGASVLAVSYGSTIELPPVGNGTEIE